ncbi:hypothetical protein BDP27DRAFT_1293488 [Rhodocollybia butyracea]|uniref:Uncharacterized protein n=1 Tax=Rhodocollybia butyracea TaxID=206335 RepID=A0A9P5U997_9AGAR|nr:hypothetical protein BDP27DRAFT_1293488 [Rhodocollybia butyracea]
MVKPPLTKTTFTLDTSGIAGFFGGEEAVTAMSTVHFFSGRWLLGWYNSPGSYTIARCYGRLAKGRLWRGLFLGDGSDPVELFGLGGKKGPRFVAAESGTNLAVTEHLAYLLSKRCQGAEMKAQVISGEWRKQNSGVNVTVVHLRRVPDIRCPMISEINYSSIFLALLTISVNVAVCAVSAIYRQWYSFAMILLGIAANGISCLVIGSGNLELRHSQPSAGSPRGDGVMIDGKNMIVLLGDEGAVNFVTKGSFFLDLSSNTISGGKDSSRNGQNPVENVYDKIPDSDTGAAMAATQSIPPYHTPSLRKSPSHVSSLPSPVKPPPSPSPSEQNLNKIGACALLLTVQFLLQLLLIPQSPLFGQILFLFSLAVSWAYNTYLASLDRENFQIEVISDCLGLRQEADKPVLKYDLATWTGAAVFVAYVLQPSNCRELLDRIIPNKTETWDKFKEEVDHVVKSTTHLLPEEKDSHIVPTRREQVVDANVEQAVVVDRLMNDLRVDAGYARTVYLEYLTQFSKFTQGVEGV